MKKIHPAYLAIGIGLACVTTFANSPQSGMLAVYGSQYQGKPTASGELYQMNLLTAAHESLPFGSILRVAHFETGKMVDVRVNDRKARDSRMLHLSHAAGQALGIPANRTVQGSMYLVGAAQAPAPAGQAARAPLPASPNPAQVTPIAPVDNQVQKPFRPFAEWKQREALRKAVNNPDADVSAVAEVPKKTGLFGRSSSTQYGIPADKYSPPVQLGETGQKQGLFSGLFAGRNQTAPVAPVGTVPAGSEIVPLSAPSNQAVQPVQPRQISQPSTQRAVVRGPYRAQFGAFRAINNARELSASLNQAGVPTLIAPANGRPLHLVISTANFATAEQAQQWINHEAARRRWTQRPVVIR